MTAQRARRFHGTVVFITVVARGQGRAEAVRIAQEGADIIGIDAFEDFSSVTYAGATLGDLEQTALLVESEGRRMLSRQVDVRDFDDLQTLVSEGVAKFGRGDFNLRVNTVHPHGVETRMNASEMVPLLDRYTATLAPTFMRSLPDTHSQPEDIANAVAFLAADEARHITGVQLPVDRGVLTR